VYAILDTLWGRLRGNDMKRIAQAISYALIALFVLVRPTEADQAPYFRQLPELKISPTNLPPVNPNQTYAVDINCSPRGGQLLPIKDNAFIQTTYTTSHSILISSQPAISGTLAPGTLPSNGLGMTLVYLTDGTQGTAVDNRNGCQTTFLIRRQNNVSKIFLIPFINLQTANQAGLAISIISTALTPITALLSLISGGPAAASVTTRISSFQSVEQGFNTVLSQLNKNYNLAQSLPLGVGKTTITTAQSVTTVTVRPMLSALINDQIDDFRNILQTLADSETVKVTEANPDSTCNQLSNDVARDGITAPEDRAYILGYEGLAVLQTPDEMMHCFGPLVKVAAGLSKIWVGQAANMIVTPEMAQQFYDHNYKVAPPQLSFADIQGTLDNLMVALGRYSRNGQPPSATNNAALAKFFAADANLVDDSFAQVFKSSPIPTGFPQIIDFLIKQGYYRFGCYAQATNQTGLASLKAQSIFLAFKAAPNATTANKSDTLAIHPIFGDSVYTIQTLDVSDNPDWIAAVLAGMSTSTPATFSCGGLKVQ